MKLGKCGWCGTSVVSWDEHSSYCQAYLEAGEPSVTLVAGVYRPGAQRPEPASEVRSAPIVASPPVEVKAEKGQETGAPKRTAQAPARACSECGSTAYYAKGFCHRCYNRHYMRRRYYGTES